MLTKGELFEAGSVYDYHVGSADRASVKKFQLNAAPCDKKRTICLGTANLICFSVLKYCNIASIIGNGTAAKEADF